MHTSLSRASISESVSDIAAGSLGCADDLHDLPALDTVVPSDGIFDLDLGQLCVLHTVLGQQLVLFLVGQHLMLGDELVLRDVHQQLRLIEELNLARV